MRFLFMQIQLPCYKSQCQCLCLNIITSTGHTEYQLDLDDYYYRYQLEQQPQQQYVPEVREYRDPWADYYEQAERQGNESETKNEIENECQTNANGVQIENSYEVSTIINIDRRTQLLNNC